jgi:hypothetical protein
MTAAALAALLLVPRAASAEPSAWMSLGGGASAWRHTVSQTGTPSGISTSFRVDPTMVIEAGAGMPDRYPVIVGGIFRVTPMLAANLGADMAWMVRAVTRGYQVGGFGVAVDAGVYARVWGDPSQGFSGSVSLGAPLGFNLSFNVMAGSGDLLAFGGTLSLDVLRLVLYRKTFLDYWPNPEVNTRKLPVASGPLGLFSF